MRNNKLVVGLGVAVVVLLAIIAAVLVEGRVKQARAESADQKSADDEQQKRFDATQLELRQKLTAIVNKADRETRKNRVETLALKLDNDWRPVEEATANFDPHFKTEAESRKAAELAKGKALIENGKTLDEVYRSIEQNRKSPEALALAKQGLYPE